MPVRAYIPFLFPALFYLLNSPSPRRSSRPFVSGYQKSSTGRVKAARKAPIMFGRRNGYLRYLGSGIARCWRGSVREIALGEIISKMIGRL